jgi:serralysin
VVAETGSSGFTIDLIFDAAAMAPAASSFRAGIEQAASMLSAAITNRITVNIKIDYSGTGGGAAAGPDAGLFEPYSTVRTDLISHAAPGDTTFNALPTGSTIQGQSNVAVWNAQLKLFGLLSPNDTTTDDGSATFATDISSNALVGVALHELTHAMGRIPIWPSR